jgi:hypothetical protein
MSRITVSTTLDASPKEVWAAVEDIVIVVGYRWPTETEQVVSTSVRWYSSLTPN